MGFSGILSSRKCSQSVLLRFRVKTLARVKVALQFNQISKYKAMATKLYVGGLPYSTTDDAMRDHFAQAGTVVSAQVVIDRMTGRSRGFGFVEMSTDDEAKNAVAMFHGKDFGGRTITVNEARPMAPRAPRSGGGGFSGGNRGGNW